MSAHTSSLDSVVRELHDKMAKARDSAILGQLNELISRGLLIVETQGPIMVRDPDSSTVRVTEAIALKLNVQEYVEKLEKENADLKAQVAGIINTMNGLSEKTGLIFQI